MNEDLTRIFRWLHRSQPPRTELSRAIVTGSVAAITNVGLLVGAVGLLVESARRPGLAAVAGVLIIIEVLAFLRSPLRFSERVSSHRLGFEAVTRWRRWLVSNIGRWDYSRWRLYAAGDLLERSLHDTDELQDLWLRCALPVINTTITMVLSDVVIALLPPHDQWWRFGAVLFAVQIIGAALLFNNLPPLIRADRTLRQFNGNFRAELVELSSVTPEVFLLGRDDFVTTRLDHQRTGLQRAERQLRRAQRRSELISLMSGLIALQLLYLMRPTTSWTWLVVVALLSIATSDMLASLRHSFDAAVAVSGSGERLEQLDGGPQLTVTRTPHDTTLRLEHVSISEGEVLLVSGADAVFAPGVHVAIVGPSGTGKSTLLRAICRLDAVRAGNISIGEVSLGEIDEVQLRAMLSYIPSEPGLTRGYARDVIALGRSGHRTMSDDLASLGIDGNDTTRFGELSRGERQRVAVVRSAVTDPSIIVADEPTSGLGAEETRKVLELLASTNATVLVATHDQQVIDWSDDVYELANGRLRRLSR